MSVSKNYMRVFGFLFIVWIIATILSYLVEWNMTRNGFMFISVCLAFGITGMSIGRYISEK